MDERSSWRRFLDHPATAWVNFIVGVLLIVLSPVVGALPGPGGIFIFALGLAMVLKTSRWARRHYVRFKRWQPKAGRWADWGLRRKSAARREAMRKHRLQLEKQVRLESPATPAKAPDTPVPADFPSVRSDLGN